MSNFTRAHYGMSYTGPSQTGGSWTPMIDIFGNGEGDYISDLSQYKAQGVRAVLKFVGPPSRYQFSNLSFSLASWKAQMDKAFNRAPVAQVRNFVNDGTLAANWIMDDCKTGSKVYGGLPPTRDDLDAMAQYSKSTWSFLPTCVRVDNDFLVGKSFYSYLDYGWAQWEDRFGPASTWFANNVNHGRQCGLGFMAGFNILNGGSGATAPWNISPNQTGKFGMSPMEIDAVGAAFSAQTYAIGVYGWAAGTNFDPTGYCLRTDMQDALQRLANRAIGRSQGPINWRESSPSQSTDTSSGSTVTVIGKWQLRDDGAGTIVRKNNANTGVVNPPSVYATGDLHCILAYSRDSALTLTLPSGWSEAKRFNSGNSAQGGELCLIYKIGSGASEAALTLSYPGAGTGGAGTAWMARWFVFSNNSTNQGTAVAASSSGRSWSSKTGMGPVAGVTSTISDALVLICAGRADDFGSGSVDENKMSATTVKAGETWGRLFMTGTATGEDAGMFVDWTSTASIPSIDSKSWAQTTGSAAGAGGGFMVAFAPFAIVSGQPPLIFSDNEGVDVTLSVGSNLSFTFGSSGSTPITWSKTSGPSNITLGSSTGAFQFTPTSVGTYVIVISASNSFGTDSTSFNVLAVQASGGGSNNAPSITNPGNKTVQEHDLLSFIVQATDADGDIITYSLEAGAPVGTFIDSTTGQFIWIPSGTQSGSHPIVVSVTDGQDISRSTFTVTVTDAPWARDRGPSSQFGQTNVAGNTFTRI